MSVDILPISELYTLSIRNVIKIIEQIIINDKIYNIILNDNTSLY